jgi:hypothetical protein
MQLSGETCRWPLWDDDSHPRMYCGAQKMEDGPYCAAHHAVARESVAARRLRILELRAKSKENANV